MCVTQQRAFLKRGWPQDGTSQICDTTRSYVYTRCAQSVSLSECPAHEQYHDQCPVGFACTNSPGHYVCTRCGHRARVDAAGAHARYHDACPPGFTVTACESHDVYRCGRCSHDIALSLCPRHAKFHRRCDLEFRRRELTCLHFTCMRCDHDAFDEEACLTHLDDHTRVEPLFARLDMYRYQCRECCFCMEFGQALEHIGLHERCARGGFRVIR